MSMSNLNIFEILKTIEDDIDDYVALCKRYGEEIEFSLQLPACYGEHSKKLEKRYEEEIKKEVLVNLVSNIKPTI